MSCVAALGCAGSSVVTTAQLNLAALISQLRRDPRLAGPDGFELLQRLEDLNRLTVYRRTADARALMRVLHDSQANSGRTPKFRDHALAVLQLLAQQPTSTSAVNS